ncbi:uncharacterized protein SCODWIG_02775 [Saccharomycodes ludwigii]|uniref:PA14 domain-containing protein n=1 Tax=Saccharomycodes ludwigii TaxID=36035 RepID=A0A376B904_9ASCO|nr:uncharacterized protein SCODWIG_02775 [Saccharomycodes ludwigii]
MLTLLNSRGFLLLILCLLQGSKLINATASDDTMDACSPISDPTEGFKVRWFNYTLDDTKSFSSLEYMAYGYYQNSAPYHISDGITTVSFQSGFPCKYSQTDPSVYFLCYGERSSAANNNWYCPSAEAPYNSYTCYNQGVNAYSLPVVYDYNTTFTNFTMEISGYFLAPETGNYTFTLGNVDDSSGLLFGQNAFGCCEQNNITSTTTDFFINAIKGLFSGQEASTSKTTLPSGTVLTDFENYVYTFDEEESYCPAYSTKTVPWTGTFTSTYTTSVLTSTDSNSNIIKSTVVYVETPEFEGTTTTYTSWTGTYTSTIGTSVTTSVGSDGITTTSTIYTVETPEAKHTTTTYKPWTGTYTSTIGTSVTTSIGSNGIPTTSTIYTCYHQHWFRWYSNYLYYLHC